jgi:predicted O-methyltransferase YrrM
MDCCFAWMQKAIAFLNHLLNSKTLHGTHSPFVYALLRDCIYNSMKVQKEVSSYFNGLKKRGDTVKGVDHGAGQSVQSNVGALARRSATQSFESNLLGRLAHYHSSKRILELGGNLGKASAVIASMNTDSEVVSVEGNEGLTALAQEGFDALGIQNVSVVHSTFDSFFDRNESKFDFVFIDGDHSYEPTMRYYEKAKNVLTGVGPIVLHDIYWSKGMTRAWDEIKQDPKATITIDLFFVGLVYFREEQQKEHFRIRFPRPLFGLFL